MKLLDEHVWTGVVYSFNGLAILVGIGGNGMCWNLLIPNSMHNSLCVFYKLTESNELQLRLKALIFNGTL